MATGLFDAGSATCSSSRLSSGSSPDSAPPPAGGAASAPRSTDQTATATTTTQPRGPTSHNRPYDGPDDDTEADIGSRTSQQQLGEERLTTSDAGIHRGLVADLARRVVDGAGGRPVRILEVGAGRGHLTWQVADALRGATAVEYHVTDIGRSFLVAAQQEAAARGLEGYRFGRLDISADPVAQGFEAGAFDLVLAFNVLVATPSMADSLASVERLLAPGGLAAVIEMADTNRAANLIGGLFDGPGDPAYVRPHPRPVVPDPSGDGGVGPGPDDGTAPATALEALLARTWAEVLGVDRVGRHDNFFTLGGDSLVATRLIVRLRDLFEGTDVPIQVVFDTPDVAAMAAALVGAVDRPEDLEQVAEIHAQVEALTVEEIDAAVAASTVPSEMPSEESTR